MREEIKKILKENIEIRQSGYMNGNADLEGIDDAVQKIEDFLKEQTNNPNKSPSLVSEEEIQKHSRDWADTAFKKGSEKTSTITEDTEWRNREYNFYKGIKLGLSLSNILVKEGEKDSEDLALKNEGEFSEWCCKNNWTPNIVNRRTIVWTHSWKTENKTTSELLQIFKQEQQKTGNDEK